MNHDSLIPTEALYCLPFLPDDFVDRLEYLKQISGLTWDGMANYMGVDPRQIRRWRHGTKPCGDTLFALLTLAARFPGGVHILLGVDILLPAPNVLAAFAGGADFKEAFVPSRALVPGGRAERASVMGVQKSIHRPVRFVFPEDFHERLARFKEASGMSWRSLARLLAVSPYRLREWRLKGVVPGPDHLFHLLTLAESMGLRDGVLMISHEDLPDETPLRIGNDSTSDSPLPTN